MTHNEKKSLYESIMKEVAKTVKRRINEGFNNLNIDDSDIDWGQIVTKEKHHPFPQNRTIVIYDKFSDNIMYIFTEGGFKKGSLGEGEYLYRLLMYAREEYPEIENRYYINSIKPKKETPFTAHINMDETFKQQAKQLRDVLLFENYVDNDPINAIQNFIYKNNFIKDDKHIKFYSTVLFDQIEKKFKSIISTGLFSYEYRLKLYRFLSKDNLQSIIFNE